jgi:hypothetical protein
VYSLVVMAARNVSIIALDVGGRGSDGISKDGMVELKKGLNGLLSPT